MKWKGGMMSSVLRHLGLAMATRQNAYFTGTVRLLLKEHLDWKVDRQIGAHHCILTLKDLK